MFTGIVIKVSWRIMIEHFFLSFSILRYDYFVNKRSKIQSRATFGAIHHKAHLSSYGTNRISLFWLYLIFKVLSQFKWTDATFWYCSTVWLLENYPLVIYATEKMNFFIEGFFWETCRNPQKIASMFMYIKKIRNGNIKVFYLNVLRLTNLVTSAIKSYWNSF